jgi:hypothetical protein
MRSFRFELLIPLLVCTSLSAQQSTPQSSVTPAASPNPIAARDPAALAAIQNAVAALGGAVAIGQISDCTAMGTFQEDASNPSQTGKFTWQTAGSEFNYTVMRSNGSTRTLVSGHGTPGDLRNGVQFETGPHVTRATLPYHVPGLVLLTELNNPNYSFTYIGLENRNGGAVIHVSTGDNSDAIGSSATPQDWYFDPSSSLPVAVQYRVPDSVDASQYSTLAKDFRAWTPVNGVMVPSEFLNTINGVSRSIKISSWSFNSNLSPSTFDLPAGGVQ